MAEVVIRIEIPDGAAVRVERSGQADSGQADSERSVLDEVEIRRYWEFSTENSRKLFRAMAEEELDLSGPFSFDAVAKRLGVSHAEALTYNRNAGRGRRLWMQRHGGAEPPIRVIPCGYVSGRRRKTFCLPDGVAQAVIQMSE